MARALKHLTSPCPNESRYGRAIFLSRGTNDSKTNRRNVRSCLRLILLTFAAWRKEVGRLIETGELFEVRAGYASPYRFRKSLTSRPNPMSLSAAIRLMNRGHTTRTIFYFRRPSSLPFRFLRIHCLPPLPRNLYFRRRKHVRRVSRTASRRVFQSPYINPLFNTPLSARLVGK